MPSKQVPWLRKPCITWTLKTFQTEHFKILLSAILLPPQPPNSSLSPYGFPMRCLDNCFPCRDLQNKILAWLSYPCIADFYSIRRGGSIRFKKTLWGKAFLRTQTGKVAYHTLCGTLLVTVSFSKFVMTSDDRLQSKILSVQNYPYITCDI